MTDDDTQRLPDELLALLAESGVWEEVDPGLEDATVAAVLAEIDLGADAKATEADATLRAVTPTADRGVVRQLHLRSALLGAAAALLIAVGAAGVFQIATGTEGADVELALIGTPLAPDASGEASVSATPNGTRILLTTTDLAPAPAGSYYEAWLRTGPDVGVSAGTFHLRGGDGDVELWAGVLIDDYPLLTVTLQPEGESASSGQVVLSARLED